MEYLKRVAKAMRESNWAKVGSSIVFAIQALSIIAVISGITFGIDTLVKMLFQN